MSHGLPLLTSLTELRQNPFGRFSLFDLCGGIWRKCVTGAHLVVVFSHTLGMWSRRLQAWGPVQYFSPFGEHQEEGECQQQPWWECLETSRTFVDSLMGRGKEAFSETHSWPVRSFWFHLVAWSFH